MALSSSIGHAFKIIGSSTYFINLSLISAGVTAALTNFSLNTSKIGFISILFSIKYYSLPH